jgi:hypothetical protein
MTAAALMPEPESQESVAVLVNGDAERHLLDTWSLLTQEFRISGGLAFEHSTVRLRARFGAEGAAVLVRDATALLAEMRLTGQLPRLRLGRGRVAGKDEIFFITMLAALQTGDKGRAIEAAIALLGTSQVHGVIGAARRLAWNLAERGVLLRPIGGLIFEYLAGYSSAEAPPPVADTLAEVGRPRRPVLRLLKSA